MLEAKSEPVARRTRSSGRHPVARADDGPKNDMDAAVNTPLPGERPSAKKRGLGKAVF